MILKGVPSMDQDLCTHEVVLRFRQSDIEWRIAPRDLLEVMTRLATVAARTLIEVGKAIATGDCDTCGNRRLVERQRSGGRTESVHCPDCRTRFDAAVAFEQYPMIVIPRKGKS